jgi:transposase
MAKPISVDLRERVCEAVSEGLSRHQAAARFKVSASSAIRWQARLEASGSVAPANFGGDRRSDRIEAEADFILAEIAARPDVTLVELQAKLKDRGLSVGIGSIWRFFDRRRISFKKRQRMLPSNSDPT